MNTKLTEREWIDKFGGPFSRAGDQHGMLAEQAKDILDGVLDMPMSGDHWKALQIDQRPVNIFGEEL